VNRIARAAAVLGLPSASQIKQIFQKIVAVAIALLGVGFNAGIVNAATLSSASVTLSDSRPSVTSSYTFTGSSVTSGTIKCIKAVFATTSTGEVQPTGWDGTGGSVTAASSTLVNSSATGWSLATSDGSGASAGADNVWKYTNSTGITPSTTTGATFVMAGITNASTPDTAYFLRISTYNNTDCSTSPVDNAAVEFINTSGSTLSLTIDNTLSFTVNGVNSGTNCAGTGTGAAVTSTGTTLPFGTVTSASNTYACQDLQAATNSTNGYTIFARYTAKPTNALSQTIADVSPGTNNAPNTFSGAGTEAYGYTTNDQSLSGSAGTGAGQASRFFNGTTYKYAAMTTGNAEVAYESAGVTQTTYRVTHQVGISATTFPGTYTTTIIYTCTPVY
jgi:hypothetical protein